MNRPPARGPSRPARRPAAPGRSSSYGRPPTSGRLARPGRPPQGQGNRPAWLYLALGFVVLFLVYSGYTFLRERRGPGQTGAQVLAASSTAIEPTPTVAGTATAAATPSPLPSPTRPILASGGVPGDLTPPGGQPASPLAQAGATDAPTPQATVANAVATGNTAEAAASAGANGFDQAMLQKRMLELVNKDRQDNGLRPVQWDDVAATAGQKHADEMAALGYMSHWDIDGHGPDYRYSQVGGRDTAQENVYRLIYTWEGGGGAPITDWDKVLRDAETALMHSPGHRANILAPEHNGLGIGISYQAASGTVAIAQEFANHYVSREPLPQRARPGDRIVLRGKLLPGSTQPLINIGYEPFPKPMTLDELNKTGTYTPKAKPASVPPVHVGQDGAFVAEYTLDGGAQPGLYHVLVWVDIPGARDRVLAVDGVIDVH